jgi:hypothetical protein
VSRAEHDALFDGAARRAFMGSLSRHGYRYDDLASGLQALSLPRPSAGSSSYRSLILRAAASLPHAEVWQLSDIIASLYTADQHAGGAPDIEAGYVAALLADGPALCEAMLPPQHTTHCHGIRVWMGERCSIPYISDSGLCRPAYHSRPSICEDGDCS